VLTHGRRLLVSVSLELVTVAQDCLAELCPDPAADGIQELDQCDLRKQIEMGRGCWRSVVGYRRSLGMCLCDITVTSAQSIFSLMLP